MNKVSPVLKKLLLITVVVYIIGSCLIQADLCRRLGEVEHLLSHSQGNVH